MKLSRFAVVLVFTLGVAAAHAGEQVNVLNYVRAESDMQFKGYT